MTPNVGLSVLASLVDQCERQEKPVVEEMEFRLPNPHRKDRGGYESSRTPERRKAPKIGRNTRCSCGSQVKYKKCCGR
jgi:uncharacterized protein YecA (UPF0149 family)